MERFFTLMFDFLSYMDGLCKANRLAQDQSFIHSTCSGINYVEGMLEQYQTTANFLCTSDVCSESAFLSSGGWFKRRVYMVFVLMRYEYGNAADCAEKLNTCRELFRQLKSRFVRDSQLLQESLTYLNADDIRSNETGGTFLNGCTGLYFQLSVDEPTELCYNPEEWTDNGTE